MGYKLLGIVHAQGTALPGNGQSMKLDRIVIVPGGRVSRIDLERCILQSLFCIANLVMQRLSHKLSGFGTLFTRLCKFDHGVIRSISDTYERLGVIGLFLGFGENQRNRLPIPTDEIVLQDGQAIATGSLFGRQEQRRRLQFRSVFVDHDQHNTRRRFRFRRIKAGNPSLGDCAVGKGGIDHAIHWKLCSKRRFA